MYVITCHITGQQVFVGVICLVFNTIVWICTTQMPLISDDGDHILCWKKAFAPFKP